MRPARQFIPTNGSSRCSRHRWGWDRRGTYEPRSQEHGSAGPAGSYVHPLRRQRSTTDGAKKRGGERSSRCGGIGPATSKPGAERKRIKPETGGNSMLLRPESRLGRAARIGRVRRGRCRIFLSGTTDARSQEHETAISAKNRTRRNSQAEVRFEGRERAAWARRDEKPITAAGLVGQRRKITTSTGLTEKSGPDVGAVRAGIGHRGPSPAMR